MNMTKREREREREEREREREREREERRAPLIRVQMYQNIPNTHLRPCRRIVLPEHQDADANSIVTGL